MRFFKVTDKIGMYIAIVRGLRVNVNMWKDQGMNIGQGKRNVEFC
ncbi:hypothetical protein BH11BAC4_BH11BAC4_00530 [soil metagenome]